MFIKNFENLTKNDSLEAGGKGASLGEMTNVGIPVPPGFVVLSSAFEKFLEETDLNVEIDSILELVNIKAIHTVEKASKKIQALILNAQMPEDIAAEVQKFFKDLDSEYVAVRSSATSEDSADAAWAGQLDSFLNTTGKTLLENVKKCWASLFTPRAIFYRFEKDLHNHRINVAVVVQKMIQSEVSGIAFSVHPITEDPNQLIIEAGYGLGEAIVSGSITPDSYVIEKEPQRIIDINVSKQERQIVRTQSDGNEWREVKKSLQDKQKLSEEGILELSNIIQKIENHYGFPCDIEWALEKGNLHITQSRPITTLGNTETINITNDNSSSANPKDYIRMFAGKTFSYLLSDAFLQYYKELGVACVQDEESWMSFLPKDSSKKTLKEGSKLYTDKDRYQEYRKDFDYHIKDSATFFDKILQNETLTASDVKKAFDLVRRHFSLYSKTEFFYTDEINLDKMIISVEEFDKLKLDGRSLLNKFMFEDSGYINSTLAILEKQIGIKKSEMMEYSVSELLKLVEGSEKIDSPHKKERNVFFTDTEIILFGEESRNTVNDFLLPFKEKSDVIKGTIANKGRVTATARVLVPDFSDFDKISEEVDKMQDGEILVAETTAPEIIQACKKASAIITNQGGMLSHAAIISRELDVPCVIGTDKDLIANIRTGDKLEVDANQGIITIIKEA